MRYFVYELVDPRDDSVFYVGKGQKNRHHAHLVEALNGKGGSKCARIREIIDAGWPLKPRIISRHDDEVDAYVAEAERIEAIGLANLTNIIPGGIGGQSRPFRWTEKLVNMLMPRIIRAFGRILRPGNDGRMYMCGVDCNEAVLTIVRRMMADLGGPEKFYTIWYQHGRS